MAGSTNSTIPPETEVGDDGPLAGAEAFPHGLFEGLGVRIGWAPPDAIFERPVEEVVRIIDAVTNHNRETITALADGDARRTTAVSDARVAEIREIRNGEVRIIVATGVVVTGFAAVALSLHAHVAWGLAGSLGTGAVGLTTLSLNWIIARRARSTAEPLPPPEQPEEVDQP